MSLPEKERVSSFCPKDSFHTRGRKKHLWLLSLALLLTSMVARGEDPKGLKVTKVISNKVDVGVTISGTWGSFINGKSYQQTPLDTYQGWQYTTYYDQKRRLSIARRKLPNGVWENIHFEDYIFRGHDNHNSTVLGICPKDGTIHLTFDHHGDPLHYRVSKLSVATQPELVKWNASLFGPVRDWLKKGRPLKELTYPRFVRLPQGNLLLAFRKGHPTKGRNILSLYDPDQGGWSDTWDITSEAGKYEFGGRKSHSRYAYLNGLHCDYASGRLHMSWAWREGMGSTFVNVNYAYSDDNGRTWMNSTGQKVGSPDAPIHLNSPGIAVWNVTPYDGQDNMMGQCVDRAGRPHILVWHRRNSEAPLPHAERDVSKSAHYHYWRDDEGKWHQNEVSAPVAGGADAERNRGKILATSNNNLIALYNAEATIVLWHATAKNQYRDWKVIHKEQGPWNGEPLPDLSRWREQGVLSVYMQKDPAKPNQPTDLHVIDFSFAQVTP